MIALASGWQFVSKTIEVGSIPTGLDYKTTMNADSCIGGYLYLALAEGASIC